jgi:ferredoxin-type protein NapF
MHSRVRRLRRLSQIAFLTGFLVLFGFAGRSPTLHSLSDGAASGWRLPADLFLRADPLLALSAMLSLRQILLPLLWYALPVVVLSLLLGRVFCGWVCPMGTAIDLCERIGGIRGRGPSHAPPWWRVKFYLLVALLLTMLLPAAHRSPREPSLSQSLGLSAVYLVDPIALLTRTLTLSGVAPAQWTITFARDVNLVWTAAPLVEKRPWLGAALQRVGSGLEWLVRPDSPPYFRLGLLSFAIFLGIVALGSFARRFWCRNLCPLGALLGVLGKLSPLRLRVSDKCTRCLRCVHECKMGAILEDPKQYRGPECIWCYACLAVCPEKAISVIVRPAESGRQDGLDLQRRRVLEGMGIGLAAVLLPKVDWTAKRTQAGEKVLKLSSERLIRPPGALPEDAFVTACVRCGECMKVCSTNTLQPAFGEGGLEAVGTPVLVPRMGPCAESCVACGQACPTRAIQPFGMEEKPHLFLGTANVDRSKCIAWAYGRQCMVCDEACPYDAIQADVLKGLPRPVVNDRVCVGCGECEFRCPVEPRGAIRVSASGDKRHLSRAEQRALREAASPGAKTGEEEAGSEAPAAEQDMIDKAPYPGAYP